MAECTIIRKKQKKLFDELGLQVASTHLSAPVGDQKNQVLESAAAYGVKWLVLPAITPDKFGSVDGIKEVCEVMNEANQNAQSAGFTYGYHNHFWEFQTVEGKLAYDIMLENIDSAIIMEVDTYWVQVGGQDPSQVVQKLGSRAPLLHIKDGPADKHESDMVAVGEGVIDVASVIGAGGEHTQWQVVELDRCATDMMTAVENSYKYLIGEGLARGNK